MNKLGFRLAQFAGRQMSKLFVALLTLGLIAFDTEPKDQGIGGTGVIFNGDDQGLTGTGYFGTISDFGSIIINGREVDLDEEIQVKIDGMLARISDLKIGHVIAARSHVLDSHERIHMIDVMHTVVGPLESIDQVTGIGLVLGQIIDFNSRLDHEVLSNNDWIAVSGLRTQNGVIIASRVEKIHDGNFLVRGNHQQITKALMALRLKSQSIPLGSSLVLSGAFVSGRPQIKALRHVPLTALLSKVETLLVETYLPETRTGAVKPTITFFGEKLILKSSPTSTPSSQTRQVLEGINRNGQIIVTRSARAPFDDHRSGSSIKQTSLENSSNRLSPSTSEDEITESGPNSDNQGSEGESGAEKNGGSGTDWGSDKGTNDKGTNDKGTNDKGTNDKGTNDKGTNDNGNGDKGGDKAEKD